MKAHWSDVLKDFKFKLNLTVTQLAVKKKIENRNKAYDTAYETTELLQYNYDLTVKNNLARLEVGQGFYKDDGVNFSAKSLLKPKQFRSYKYKLIVRIL
jgi:hypothetical protein